MHEKPYIPSPAEMKTTEMEEFIKKYNVPIESIIPEIKMTGLILQVGDDGRLTYENPQIESADTSSKDGRGDTASTNYVDSIIKFLHVQDIMNFLEPLKNTVVVDLGAKDAHGYYLAKGLGSKAYIGVDKFRMPIVNIDSNMEREMPRQKKLKGDTNEVDDIPHSTVKEDLLIFLRRIPDNSVSILTSAVTVGIHGRYIDDVDKEIVRVLNPKGAYISHFSVFEPNGLEKNQLKDRLQHHGGWLKFTKK